MNYEVEQKFPVADLAELAGRLTALGATVSPPQIEADVYYAHPARDFAATDEALRIRRKGTSHFLTYKGPKVDATTKTRRELELPLGSDEESAAAWAGLLQTLDFTPIAEIRKSRCKAHVAWEGRRIEVSLDDVAGVGTYAELELVVAPSDLEPAKAHIASLAAALGLSGSERRSYLELFLNSGGMLSRRAASGEHDA